MALSFRPMSLFCCPVLWFFLKQHYTVVGLSMAESKDLGKLNVLSSNISTYWKNVQPSGPCAVEHQCTVSAYQKCSELRGHMNMNRDILLITSWGSRQRTNLSLLWQLSSFQMYQSHPNQFSVCGYIIAIQNLDSAQSSKCKDCTSESVCNTRMLLNKASWLPNQINQIYPTDVFCHFRSF